MRHGYELISQRLYLLVGLLLLLSIPAVLIANPTGLIAMWQDDSFYYLVPAWHWAKDGRISTDGLGETYGYQPLWMLAHLLICKLSPTIQSAFLGVCIVQRWLLFIGAFYFCKGVHNMFGLKAFACAVGITLLAGGGIQVDLLTGKENTLSFLILSLLLWDYSQTTTMTPRKITCFSLLMLCRLSYAPAILLFFAYEIITKQAKLRTIGFVLVPILCWCAWSASRYGVLFPLSGSIKLGTSLELLKHNISSLTDASIQAAWANPWPAVRAYLERALVLFSAGTIGILLLALLLLFRTQEHCPLEEKKSVTGKPMWIFLACLSVSNLAGNLFIWPAGMGFTTWYTLPEIFIFLIIACQIFAIFADRVLSSDLLNRSLISRALWFVAIVLVFGFKSREWRTFSPRSAPVTGMLAELGREPRSWINELPKDATICSFNSGYISYIFSDYKVLNLDGLCAPIGISKSVIKRDKTGDRKSHAKLLGEYIERAQPAFLLDIQPVEWAPTEYFRASLPVRKDEVLHRSSQPFVVGPETDLFYLIALPSRRPTPW